MDEGILRCNPTGLTLTASETLLLKLAASHLSDLLAGAAPTGILKPLFLLFGPAEHLF